MYTRAHALRVHVFKVHVLKVRAARYSPFFWHFKFFGTSRAWNWAKAQLLTAAGLVTFTNAQIQPSPLAVTELATVWLAVCACMCVCVCMCAKGEKKCQQKETRRKKVSGHFDRKWCEFNGNKAERTKEENRRVVTWLYKLNTLFFSLDLTFWMVARLFLLFFVFLIIVDYVYFVFISIRNIICVNQPSSQIEKFQCCSTHRSHTLTPAKRKKKAWQI